jgi:uroporphyrinogen decarboxylase
LRACRREPVDRTPVWFMRQAGRYLPEYRALRGETDVLTLTRDPEAAAEIALQPVRRLGVDAAILFSDIMVPVAAVGIDVRIVRNQGPTLAEPFRGDADLERLRPLEPAEDVLFTLKTIRILRRELDVPLIGFAGAPFTVASYLVEGGASRDYLETKRLMYGDPAAWEALLTLLARTTARYLNGQIAAGAEAVQLFDSWVGALGPDDYRAFVLPHTRAILRALTPGVPVIHFGTGTAGLLEALREAGGDVIGLDWRLALGEGWRRLGHDVAVQGNLDPAALFAPPAEIRRRAAAILAEAAGRPGHVFNLGHGVLPGTPVDHVRALVDAVHELSQR